MYRALFVVFRSLKALNTAMHVYEKLIWILFIN